jgi:hypothetical protein
VTLNANRWTKETIFDLSTADDYSEALDNLTVRAGWHDDINTGESFLIEEETIGLNQTGQLIRRDVKNYTYELPGTPPLFFSRDTYARPYLPGTNPTRRDILVETERIEYHPWTMFQQGSPNLSRKRILAGYVVYDMTPDGDTLTGDQRAELEAKGLNPDGPPKIIVDSARLWSEANHDAEIVESATAPQVTKWIDPVESEFEIVFEEPDKFTAYSYRKNHLRPQDMDVTGPTHTRKPGYSWRLPVAIEPPKIEATGAGDEGIRLTATGGGATVGTFRVRPESYRILRRIISEPAKPEDPDPLGLYTDPPPAGSRSTMWTDTDVTDLTGAPASALPTATPYTEPGDVTEPDGDEWTLVAELPNQRPEETVGLATVVDDQVINLGQYEYIATAIIGSDESAPSPPDRFTYGGASRSSRMVATVRRTPDGDLEIDVLAPDPDLYGETREFDIPIAITEDEAPDLGEELGIRNFAEDLEPGLQVDLEITVPLAILERGQKITTPAIDWTTTGNNLIITSETEVRDWLLDGFRITASREGGGDLTVKGTTLYLTEI